MTGSEKIVVFDLGGVLVRICRSWQEGCALAGVPVRDEVADGTMIGRWRQLMVTYQEGHLTCQAFFSQASAAMNGVYSPEELARIHDAWLIGLYEGAETLVEELVESGVTTGVLSNTNHRHWLTMTTTYAPLARIAHPHASHLLRASKPSDDIYRLFEERTDVKPADIVFFDDLEDNIAAAARRGWSAHQIDFAGDTAAQMRRVLRQAGVLP